MADVKSAAGRLSTESASLYNNLESMPTEALLAGINAEDMKVPIAINGALTAIRNLIEAILPRMRDQNGRLFYIGAGTSGRLGVVDASECPPTYGIPHGVVVGIIAGGDGAIRKAVEKAEDNFQGAWTDLQAYGIRSEDCVIGIAASGRTPYVVGGLRDARQFGCITGCIVCNTGSIVAANCDYPVEVVVGPEFVTGSTRMKSGTAQKLVLNMVSTSLMIRLGHVKGNSMVDMQLTNEKLVARGGLMLKQQLELEMKQLMDPCTASDTPSTDNKTLADAATSSVLIERLRCLLRSDEETEQKREQLLLQCGNVRATVDFVLNMNSKIDL